MQPSYYLKTYPAPDDPEQLLLFSTRKAATLLLAKKTFQALEAGQLSDTQAATLERFKMLVPDQEAEKRAMLALLDTQNPRNKGLLLTVILNLDCNFACPYCFEEGAKGKLYITGATAELITAFLESRWQEHKDSLRIDFYGGEPLLSLDLIVSISQAAQSFAAARSARFFSTLTTNGSLFTRKVAARLVPLGLTNVKITLDGPAEQHNQSRPFKSGTGSFEAIIQNIKATCDLLKVGVGGNYTQGNYRLFPRLLDYLETEGLTPAKISQVKFEPIVNLPGNNGSPAKYSGGCLSVNEPWLVAAEAFLREEILRRGYNASKPTPMACMIETTDSYVVNYDGIIYKCPAFIGKQDFAVGSLDAGVGDYTAALKLGMYKNPECAACVYLPLCFGGCRYMTYVREGKIDKIDCKKEYLDAALEGLIKQDIKYRERK